MSSVIATKSSGASPDKRRKYDEAFKVEALRLASESRSTQAAARQLGVSPKLLYRWQQAQAMAANSIVFWAPALPRVLTRRRPY
ncbi:hypothetical protein D0N36_14830 [Hymenobacter lapidiphilus]|nr:hypothetical protein D0N36_14830 [Hymenobacter sp. CCM 8763]